MSYQEVSLAQPCRPFFYSVHFGMGVKKTGKGLHGYARLPRREENRERGCMATRD